VYLTFRGGISHLMYCLRAWTTEEPSFESAGAKESLFVKALRPDLGPNEGSFEGRKAVAA